MKRFQPSAETETKERHFRGLLGGIHVPVCKSIRERQGRPTDPPYLYIDLHGGPGILEYQGRRFPGSPIIANEVLAASGMPYEALHFEHDFEVATELQHAINAGGYSNASVFMSPFQQGLKRWLIATPRHGYRYGLVYSDPINDPIPVQTFNLIAAHFPRVDLLAYIAANDQYKRANANGYGHGRQLIEDVAAVDKQIALIRQPRGAHQWTFILWTNWTKLKEWRAEGFHRLDTRAGQRIMAELNWTARELHAMANEALPFEEADDGALL